MARQGGWSLFPFRIRNPVNEPRLLVTQIERKKVRQVLINGVPGQMSFSADLYGKPTYRELTQTTHLNSRTVPCKNDSLLT